MAQVYVTKPVTSTWCNVRGNDLFANKNIDYLHPCRNSLDAWLCPSCHHISDKDLTSTFRWGDYTPHLTSHNIGYFYYAIRCLAILLGSWQSEPVCQQRRWLLIISCQLLAINWSNFWCSNFEFLSGHVGKTSDYLNVGLSFKQRRSFKEETISYNDNQCTWEQVCVCPTVHHNNITLLVQLSDCIRSGRTCNSPVITWSDGRLRSLFWHLNFSDVALRWYLSKSFPKHLPLLPFF